MASIRFILAWTLIAAAAIYDGYFAWEYRSVLSSWELNPLARWAATSIGLSAVLVFKTATLAFGLGIAWYCRARNQGLERRLTGIIGAAYLGLSAHYIVTQVRHPIDMPGVIEQVAHNHAVDTTPDVGFAVMPMGVPDDGRAIVPAAVGTATDPMPAATIPITFPSAMPAATPVNQRGRRFGERPGM